ncbi:hypothetical protein DFQ27_002039 [Actinomortierella ambigua]|uniref:F-box domain-containing protein n=1 Tax=Actinomortierella ambigua TaxID=1343610 RepID=A0A9P6QAD6_9FUNG|nr:hypothetical protein DFQ27_002039 [Actinomortierella ambigua]
MKSSSLLDCPELLQWIARHLDRENVATCMLVSKLWNAQFGAVLWHTVRLPVRDVPLLLNDDSLRAALQKHGRHVRSLTFLGPQLPALEGIKFLFQHCQQLDELVMGISQLNDDWVKASTLIRHSSKLDKITLAVSTAALVDPTKLTELLALAPQISSLSLSLNAGPPSIILQLLSQCKYLRRLQLGIVAEETWTTQQPTELSPNVAPSTLTTPTTATTPAYGLQELSIISCPWPLAEHLLRHSPNLQRLKLPKIDRTHLPSLQQALMHRTRHGSSAPRTTTFLQTLHLQHLSHWQDRELAQLLLKACPPNTLRHLYLCGTQAGDLTLTTILKYQSAHLETLDLRDTEGTAAVAATAALPSTSLQALLANCRQLRVFAAGNTCGTAALSAKDIVSMPWCCLRLRVLRVPIIGICRDDSCRTHELCHLIQRQIYGQLGRLTHLEDLDLSNRLDTRGGVEVQGLGVQVQEQQEQEQEKKGKKKKEEKEKEEEEEEERKEEKGVDNSHGSDDDGAGKRGWSQWPVEPESLEWTLERGMDQLARLVRLRSFDLRGTDHLLSEEEIIWMKDHWPNLRRLLGLASHPRVLEVQEFTREYWPEIRLE